MYQPYKMNHMAKYQELSSFPEVSIFSSVDSSIIKLRWIFSKQSRLKLRIEKQSKTLAPENLFQLIINLSLNFLSRKCTKHSHIFSPWLLLLVFLTGQFPKTLKKFQKAALLIFCCFPNKRNEGQLKTVFISSMTEIPHVASNWEWIKDLASKMLLPLSSTSSPN